MRRSHYQRNLCVFRLLNAEVERAYNLGFHDDRVFYVIASDGGLLNAPTPVTRLPLAVGERYEILVDLRHDPVGSTLEFRAYNENQPFEFPVAKMPVMANSVACSITPLSPCCI
jgi:FtsP/CotA-like multicopper oxidase with cupredoxin domain